MNDLFKKSIAEVLVRKAFSGEYNGSDYVKCGFCSGCYLRGTTSHSCFLKPSEAQVVIY